MFDEEYGVLYLNLVSVANSDKELKEDEISANFTFSKKRNRNEDSRNQENIFKWNDWIPYCLINNFLPEFTYTMFFSSKPLSLFSLLSFLVLEYLFDEIVHNLWRLVFVFKIHPSEPHISTSRNTSIYKNWFYVVICSSVNFYTSVILLLAWYKIWYT